MSTLSPQVLDVRTLACENRHARIFSTFETLADGDAFDLVNDHDPRPLRAHFDLRHPGRFDWTYLESGPEVWRVRITRKAGAKSGSDCCSGGSCCG